MLSPSCKGTPESIDHSQRTARSGVLHPVFPPGCTLSNLKHCDRGLPRNAAVSAVDCCVFIPPCCKISVRGGMFPKCTVCNAVLISWSNYSCLCYTKPAQAKLLFPSCKLAVGKNCEVQSADLLKWHVMTRWFPYICRPLVCVIPQECVQSLLSFVTKLGSCGFYSAGSCLLYAFMVNCIHRVGGPTQMFCIHTQTCANGGVVFRLLALLDCPQFGPSFAGL